MNWAEKLATYFPSKGVLYIVSDEYGIFNRKAVLQVITQKEIIVHTYQDPVVFRYEYETSFRHEDRKSRPTWVVIIGTNQFNQLPYDILSSANRLSISWETIFPSLDSTVVQYCPDEVLQLLFDASNTQLKPLNYNESIDFILTEVYQLDSSIFSNEINLIKAAIRYFDKFSEALPTLFFKRLEQSIRKSHPFFSKEALNVFISKDNLTRLLNKQWERYIQDYLKRDYEQIDESRINYDLSFYSDPMIRQTLTKFITPIPISNKVKFEKWMTAGLVMENKPSIDADVLFTQDFSKFSRLEWGGLASQIGEIQYNYLNDGTLAPTWHTQMQTLNEHFEKWMIEDYANLRTLPVVPKPKMVHQIPHFLARKIDRKVALIVMDGMNFTQWHMIKQHLASDGWSFEEDAVFSWIPSVTSVSRQAIFSGLEPRQFADTIFSTRKEKTYWTQFWEQVGFTKQNVAYENSLGLEVYNQSLLAYTQFPSIRIYGAVIDVIDQFMHGAVQGNQTMISELSTWLSTNYLNRFLEDLIDQDFDVYITSDHGNVECLGIGRIQEGVLVNSKGERSRIYQSENIRNQTHLTHTESTISWNNPGLPKDYHVLIAKKNHAFVPKDDKIVTHGGIHFEEVIVPFVKVKR
ncbi:BREX-3 system phosphatase PglZ [Bacillus massilinigeriensis]|uniref:BREX-3 system phosphatase PglZ n=1 Tax=Bacillus massilionigeriensis TaxID=1805475 RepID=UPI00096AEC51|nr:BREX-3 system phosphatase PglZ [Bacillus massilionigeriensis]